MQQVNPTSGKINLDPDKAEHGLAQLVLTVVELLRQIVERHAIRRVEGGTLSDEEIERLGEALMNLEEKMEELREVFGLEAEDLNIDLGPLGSLL
ncbi:gas vesicle protein K [Jeotgalibacillus haloalkalitolerans]|uniref:Gas vesicle protein K n=1 Tax=Jeotgalibacillus haloalkalitolerans TaxID=3104292 RepID=A0ABU5KK15_9BACL|nr:gas vesicle protein K [Jeotgalibacillus sp. HH7-29]MDZ5711060.1 gas vesicle protein K [Jeotgalibacillus sp. HH7-29]